MNDYFKKFIIFFCIFGLLFSFVRPQPVKANPMLVAIGGVEISAEACMAFACISLYAGGAVIDYANGTDSKLLQALGNDLVSCGHAAEYLSVKADETGQKFLSWTVDGLSWFNQEVADLFSQGISSTVTAGYYTIARTGVSIYANTVNSPYYIIPTLYIPSGVTVSGRVFNWSSDSQTFSYTNSSSSTVSISVGMFYDSSSYSSIGYWVNGSFAGSTRTFPQMGSVYRTEYSLSGDSVCYTPPTTGAKQYDNTVNQDVIGGTASGSILGIPLTVGSDGVVSVPSIPSNKTWGDISGDFTYTPAKDLPVDVPTDVADSTGTISDTGVLSIPVLGDILKVLLNILQLLKDMIGNFITALTKMITDIFVPSDTFFTDEFNKLKAPVIAKFPQNLDILNSLKTDGFAFTDIMAFNAVIISAKYVNDNISFIRAITSCFWVFLLVMYVWRKINQFLTGNEVIQPTVRDKGV